MNIVPVKRALAIAAVSAVAVGLAGLASAETRPTHEAHKVSTTRRVIAADQSGSHYTWRYFGGPRGGLWPAPGN